MRTTKEVTRRTTSDGSRPGASTGLPRVVRVVPLMLLIALTAWGSAPAPVEAQTTAGPVSGDPTIVILVRHAERADDGSTSDPDLSAAGVERARCLARTLANAGVTSIRSTNYRRTLRTAAPLAEALGLDIETYDPRDLSAVAADLASTGGTIVVVGHSNTTPELVRALGGDPVGPMGESDYDRLYTVFVSERGVRSTLISYCG